MLAAAEAGGINLAVSKALGGFKGVQGSISILQVFGRLFLVFSGLY